MTAHPDESAAVQRAFACCESIVHSGSQVGHVFFMHDANFVAVHPSASQWTSFAAANNVALQTCISTAEQKSIQSRYYAAGFLQGGLSTLADSILSSDVVYQFNSDDDGFQLELTENAVEDRKKILFIFETEPSENSFAAEGVDLLLVLSAFEADITVVFKADGIKNLTSDVANRPRYTKRFKALEDFGVNQLFIVAKDDQEVDENIKQITHDEFCILLNENHTLRF